MGDQTGKGGPAGVWGSVSCSGLRRPDPDMDKLLRFAVSPAEDSTSMASKACRACRVGVLGSGFGGSALGGVGFKVPPCFRGSSFGQAHRLIDAPSYGGEPAHQAPHPHRIPEASSHSMSMHHGPQDVVPMAGVHQESDQGETKWFSRERGSRGVYNPLI